MVVMEPNAACRRPKHYTAAQGSLPMLKGDWMQGNLQGSGRRPVLKMLW